MKNWKTTLAGAIAALGVYFSTQEGPLKIIGQILVGAGSFLTGLFAKDSNVTGGTTKQ